MRPAGLLITRAGAPAAGLRRWLSSKRSPHHDILMPPGNWPIEIADLGEKGRGMRVTKRVRKGDVLLVEEPVASVFVRHDDDEVPPIERRNHKLTHSCLEHAEARKLDNAWAEEGRNHPRLAMRIMARVLKDIVTNPNGGAQDSWGVLRLLTNANLEYQDPPEWTQDISLLKYSLTGGGADENGLKVLEHVFSMAWYREMMGILHLNTTRIAAPLNDTTTDGWLGKQMPRQVSAVFQAASMFNHSCVPNVAVAYGDLRRAGAVPQGNALTWSFVAVKDMYVGQEASLSYVDTSLGNYERIEYLMLCYGFQCRCRRCVRSGIELEFSSE